MRRALAIISALALVAAIVGVGVVATQSHARRRVLASGVPHASAKAAAPDAAAPDAVIVRENLRKGTSAWKIGGGVRARANGVEGFASATSVAIGDPFDIYVRTQARSVHAAIFRMGWYGGTGARLVARLSDVPGDRQKQCGTSASRGTISCDWRPTFHVRTTSQWVSGIFLIQLLASDRSVSYVPIVVRESVPRAPILVQASVTTWQAYNTWGGRSLYLGPCLRARRAPTPHASPSPSASPSISATPTPTPSPTPTRVPKSNSVAAASSPSPDPQPASSSTGVPQAARPTKQSGEEGAPGMCYAERSRAVSFDRPYVWPGAGQFFRLEFPFVSWLERRGYGVAYSTDIDLHEGNDALERRAVFISVGHDEYYSKEMRDALTKARDDGTSLAFFGGNDAYRHARFESSPVGPDRIEVNYKSAGEDPLTSIDPSESTADWRSYPTRAPEQSLLGAQWVTCDPAHADWVATGQPSWLYRGTGLRAGDTVHDLVGYEFDRWFVDLPPRDVTLVANSPTWCRGRLMTQNTTLYVAPSGAGVFDAGSVWFPCAFGRGCKGHPSDARMERLADNLLAAMLSKHFGAQAR